MKNAGFVYVLANSAMTGLVKVGKTNRDPIERAQELSRATGLPSPFIVVFEQYFEDCDVAERFVHVFLAQNGYRIAPNREFFNAPVNQIIRAIMAAPGAIENHRVNKQSLTGDEVDHSNEAPPNASNPYNNPGIEIFFDAYSHYYGSTNTLQDEIEALRLFKRAASLGALQAYPFIGRIYMRGEEIRRDVTAALNAFREGARRGDISCYFEIGKMYLDEGKSEKANEAFRLFVEKYRGVRDGDEFISDEELESVYQRCGHILVDRSREQVPNSLLPFYKEYNQYIARELDGTLAYARKVNDQSFERDILTAIKLVKELSA